MKLKKKKVLSGGKLAGGNPKNERVENDFYATNPKAVEMLLEAYPFKGYSILEPCVGAGHIIQGIKNFLCDDEAILDITALDIVDRGYPNTIIQDFLKWNTKQKFDIIITNPPFSQVREFIRYLVNKKIDFIIIVSDVLRYSIAKGKTDFGIALYKGH